MAAKIKLQRVGTKNRPFYRVVVQDESFTPTGKIVEIIGTYQPLKSEEKFTVDKEKAIAWVKKGAKPTDRVRILLGKAGVLPPVDLAALKKRKPKGEATEEKPAEAAAAAPAQA